MPDDSELTKRFADLVDAEKKLIEEHLVMLVRLSVVSNNE